MISIIRIVNKIIANIRIVNKIMANKKYPIIDKSISDPSSSEKYWSYHSVNPKPFFSIKKSINDLNLRFEDYPKFKELMDLWGVHKNETILDYGCGPGNDLIGFLTFSQVKKVVGIDVSWEALKLAQSRLYLHKIDPNRVDLLKISDNVPEIPTNSDFFDYIYSEGVLHHTSHPEKILKEMYRVLKKGCKCHIMVYNKDSIWYHLYVPYVKKILKLKYENLSDDEAFSKTTDGEVCPISRCYCPNTFIEMCENSGFFVKFLGGYLSSWEIEWYEKYGVNALKDTRLSSEHKDFIQKISIGSDGLPMINGYYAGIGGVYYLEKV